MKIPTFHLLIGDPFLCDEKFKSLRSDIEKQTEGEVSFSSFRISQNSMDQILSEARGLPFSSACQLFRIRDVELIKEKKMEGLEEYFENPSPKTHLIFEAAALSPDHVLRKIIQKAGEVTIFDEKQKRSGGEQFIKEKLREFGKTMTPQAMERLCNLMGDHPIFLNSVLEQMLTYATDQNVLDETMLEKFEEKWQELDSFALADAIGNRSTQKSLLIIRKLLSDSESDAIALVGVLHWLIKRFWKAAFLLEEGESQERILRECRISPRQATFFWRQLKMFTRQKLEMALEDLFQLDLKLKTGQVDKEYGLESWVIRTTQR